MTGNGQDVSLGDLELGHDGLNERRWETGIFLSRSV
jgi:hypothetical protein